MEIELAVLNSQAKADLQPKVRAYRFDFDGLKRQYFKLCDKFGQQRDREALAGAFIDDVMQRSKDTGSRLRHTTRGCWTTRQICANRTLISRGPSR